MPDHSTFQRFTPDLHCNYFLELCALIVLVAITIAYFSRKKFPVATARLFGVGLLTLVLNVGSDILFCVLLDNSDTVPLIWVELVADFFFSMQFVLSYLLFAFVLYSVGKSLKYSPIYLLTIVPSAFGAVWFFTNHIHHLNFSFVLDAMKKRSGLISNVRSYLITTLYNAANTMSNFYSNLAHNDIRGGLI